MTTSPIRSLAGLALVAVLVLAGCSSGGRTVAVTHGPVTLAYADLGTPGPSVGDTRSTTVATQLEGSSTTGRLDAILSTTGEDVPGPGDEVRIGHLVFSFGSGSDQIVVDGSSVYPSASSTIPASTSTIRPIVGGSGAYAGATGWCESFHNADGTWRHVFHLTN